LYQGLLLLSDNVGEEDEKTPNSTANLGETESLYEGLVSLRGDVVPGEEVKYSLIADLPW
jgi:hypothetical protein